MIQIQTFTVFEYDDLDKYVNEFLQTRLNIVIKDIQYVMNNRYKSVMITYTEG